MAEYGTYGIKSVPSDTPNALTCGDCGRSWTEDITPAGRCPWEDTHDESEDEPYTLTDVVGTIQGYLDMAREGEDKSSSLTEPANHQEMYWRGARIAYENVLAELRDLT